MGLGASKTYFLGSCSRDDRCANMRPAWARKAFQASLGCFQPKVLLLAEDMTFIGHMPRAVGEDCGLPARILSKSAMG